MMNEALHKRFWTKVDKVSEAPCWVWTASRKTGGEGQFGIIKKGRPFPESAHKVAWELENGAIPEGAWLRHLCRRKDCVRPEHLALIRDDKDRLLLFVEKAASGCWLWTGYIDPRGYGRFAFTTPSGRQEQAAHRASFILHRGDIPEGLLIRHLCDVPRCVNPDHLYPGTNADNSADQTRGKRTPVEEDLRRQHEAYILGWRCGAALQPRPSFVDHHDAFEAGYLKGLAALQEAQLESPFNPRWPIEVA